MLAEATLLFIFLGVCAGILIGAAGIGGVIFGPSLGLFRWSRYSPKVLPVQISVSLSLVLLELSH